MSRLFGVVILAVLLVPQVLPAQVLVVTKTGYYLLETAADGTPKLTPHAGFKQVIFLDGVPGPPPPPPPNPTLTQRAIAIRDAALRATADKQRDRTAAMLSVLYSETAKQVRSGQLKSDNISIMASTGATMVLAKSAGESGQTQAAIEAAWKPMRDTLTAQWAAALQEGGGDLALAALLEEASSGLLASVPQEAMPRAIDLEQIIRLIMAIMEIIKQLFPKGLPR